MFIAIGAFSVNTPGLLLLSFIPFAVAWVVVRRLNDPDDLKDTAEYARFNSILEKMNTKESFVENEESLSKEDILKLQTMSSDGYRFPESYIRKIIQANQKITYQGYITTKYWDEDGHHIGIGKTVSITIPIETYRGLSLGDYVRVTIAFVRLTISIARPHFVLSCEILRKAEELELKNDG
jgi:hypothetical protein